MAASPALPSAAASCDQVLSRQVLGVRLLVTACVAAQLAPALPVSGALLLTSALSCLLLLPGRGRHRAPLLAADAAAGALLLALTVPTLPDVPIPHVLIPLVLIPLCGPLLAGLTLGRRAAALCGGGQALAVAAVTPGLSLALPLLCVLAGAAGAAVREHLLRVEALAARSERERLAREMHDSVAKTLHGLALTAEALSRTADPETMRRHADLIATAARTAAAESRQVLTRLRRNSAPATSARTLLPAAVAREVLAVAEEALENARRHAGATDATLHLVVEDAGRGLPQGVDLPALRAAGHFGLLGMTERAAAIGARLHIGARAGGPGTRVSLTLPLGKGA